MKRQEEISYKSALTKADEDELEAIGKKLAEWPLVTENSEEDNDAMRLIRETAELFREINRSSSGDKNGY